MDQLAAPGPDGTLQPNCDLVLLRWTESKASEASPAAALGDAAQRLGIPVLSDVDAVQVRVNCAGGLGSAL